MGRIRDKSRWRCGNCCAVNFEPDMLTAPSPFDPTETLTACPSCKQCDEGFEKLCDEPGCNEVVGGGYPTGDNADEWGGYRHTCGKHFLQNAAIEAQPRKEQR